MAASFRDRVEAGRRLALLLSGHHGDRDTIVVALPRGGVPVASEIARELGLPMDVLVVRKLGVPGNEEYAMGAMASGGVRVLNVPAIAALGLDRETIEATALREGRELARREQVFRRGRPPLEVRGKTVILVDDGVATGSTLRAAIQSLREREARRVIVAVPTIAPDTLARMRGEADAWVTILVPATFHSVGEWYESFPQVSDSEVMALLGNESSATAVEQRRPRLDRKGRPT